MPIMMVSPRDYTLRSLTGYVIFYPANQPTHTPDEVVSEAMAVNILPVEKYDREMPAPRGALKESRVTGTLRDALILNAIEELVKENDVSNFNAGGSPKLAALNGATGLRLSGPESSKYWTRYREIKGTNSPLPQHPRMESVLELQRLTTRKQLLEYASEIGFPESEVSRRPLKEAKEALMQATINYVEVATSLEPDTGSLEEN